MNVTVGMMSRFVEARAPIATKAGLLTTATSGSLIKLLVDACQLRKQLKTTAMASSQQTPKQDSVALTAKNAAGAGRAATLSSGCQTS